MPIRRTQFDLPEPEITRHVRSDLRQGIERHWLGKENSNIGLQGVSFLNGHLEAHVSFGRSDVLMIQYPGCCNVFVDNWTDWQIDRYTGIELTVHEEGVIAAEVRKQCSLNYAYLERELTFLKRKPWLQLDGKTPQEAIEILSNLGW